MQSEPHCRALAYSQWWARGTRAIAAALIVGGTQFGGCGGSDHEPVTFVVGLRVFDELNSFLEVQKKLDDSGIEVRAYMCGFADFAKVAEIPPLWIEGRTPRVVYFTVSYEDGRRAAQLSIPTFRFWTDAERNAHSDPFDCGPVPSGPG